MTVFGFIRKKKLSKLSVGIYQGVI